MRSILICLVLIYVAFVSCSKQQLNNARESVIGSWRVTEIYTEQKDTSGINNDGRHWESGELGNFIFDAIIVTYQYTRLDSVYNGTNTWSLGRDKVHAGFYKVEQYILQIGDQTFDCDFDDGTANAEKNATRMKLSYTGAGNNPNIIFTLNKY
jgi:hypothetical protein